MKTNKLFFLFSMLLGMSVTDALAYDIAAKNADGVMIYYDYDSNNADQTEVYVTYETRSYNSYSGSVVIPKEVTYDDKTLKVTGIKYYAFAGCSELISVTIPNSVATIGEYAFAGCSKLTSITIPESVTSFGSLVFSDCSALTSIIVEKENSKYDSRNDCNAIIETHSNTLIAACKNTVIPNNVTTIGKEAFGGISNLETITIPDNVTTIGDYAFYACSGLTSITIPNTVTSLGGCVFYGCI